ncbi:GTPase HflX [Desulfosoma caldarium]|uniref:GTPase HflX n=1 Tax=Desulfosoma caldarium TaxID=610254 RepID=A0A3N1ULM8_9BACT|nr:GTPase HflX [Desulfosoma caldarium]ROQ90983.1 GTP-binding protein HflX [Desulfosoma caldarium]
MRKRLENLTRRRSLPRDVVSPDLARDLARLSFDSGRQIGVMIGRDGAVEMVLVGDSRSLYIPDLPKSRAGRWRLRGLRFVHTHLREEPLTQDDLMDLVFLRLDCIAVIRVDLHGGAKDLEVAHILPASRQTQVAWRILPPTPCAEPTLHFLEFVQSLEEELERERRSVAAEKAKDRAILVSVTTEEREVAEASLAELKELACSAGISVADSIVQRQRQANPKYLIGKGKLSEIIVRALQCGVDLLIFDQDLNPSQIRSITDTTELRVIDRTQLILDIFAQRAHSREGKLQVEIAQLKYLLPRLGVKDDALSRLRGGIGVRGPGETKLEINRRRIKDRIAHLEKQLQQVRKNRSQRRAKRLRQTLPILSIVGYTNAGKSTLLNTLTHSRVWAEDQLFATLDPTTRRLRFPRDMEVIVTDTVGFIRNLPQNLLDAFAATLEELNDADLLLHVVDLSNPHYEDHMASVAEILEKLGLDRKPTVLVFNKMDKVDSDTLARALQRYEAVAVSAIDRTTLWPLLEVLQNKVENFFLPEDAEASEHLTVSESPSETVTVMDVKANRLSTRLRVSWAGKDL